MSNASTHQHFTRGGQIAFHNLRMLFQIHKALLHVHCISWLILFAGFTWLWVPRVYLIQATNYIEAVALKQLKKEHLFEVPFEDGVHQQTVAQLTKKAYYSKVFEFCSRKIIESARASFTCSFVLACLLSIYFVRRGKQQTEHQRIRGSQFLEASLLKQQIKYDKNNSDIEIDGFPLILNSECQHQLVHGTVGTGKSQLIMKIMDSLRKRGDRVIVYDKGCALIPYYYQENHDHILNPFDSRCANWDLWQEAPTDSDLENMAESLMPIQGESDPFWVNAARVVFVSAASKMREDEARSHEKLLQLLLVSSFEALEHYLKDTPAAALINSKIEKTSTSIRTVITTYVKSLQLLEGLQDKPFSIRDYLLNPSEKGWLFISSNGAHHKVLKPLMSMWLAMASLTMLSLAPNRKQRVWFICDELPSLHRLPLLGETIAEVRKFGGCFLLGMQSFSQLEKVYGRSGAQEIFDLLNTRFFFRSPSSDMARLVSRELGEEDIDESKEHYSYGANSVRDGISLGTQRAVRPIVSYPEIAELSNLNCFVRLPGAYPITKLTLQYSQRSVLAQGLIERSKVMPEKSMKSLSAYLED